VHDEPQQKPSTQKVLVHWSPAVHAEPVELFGTQTPELHQKPDAQLVSAAQLDRQLVPEAHSRLLGHAVGDPGAHVPDPLQASIVSMPFAQVTPHAVPDLACSHAPAAPQRPSFPQGALMLVGHCPEGAAVPAV
jgi:hypothetical protein